MRVGGVRDSVFGALNHGDGAVNPPSVQFGALALAGFMAYAKPLGEGL